MTDKTYTGTCQACGRRQAIHIHTGKIAKHGYTTDWGFFNGVCGGSDNHPLETHDAINRETVNYLRVWADERLALAAGEITKVTVNCGRDPVTRKPIHKQVDRAEFEATQPRYESFDREVEIARHRLRGQAKQAADLADDLDTLRDRVHGQPLLERPEEAPLKRETFPTYREAALRVSALKDEGITARQRRQRGVGFVVTYR